MVRRLSRSSAQASEQVRLLISEWLISSNGNGVVLVLLLPFLALTFVCMNTGDKKRRELVRIRRIFIPEGHETVVDAYSGPENTATGSREELGQPCLGKELLVIIPQHLGREKKEACH
jgi:hypothetical protein